MIDAAAMRVSNETGISFRGFSFFADYSTKPPRYVMLIEPETEGVTEETRNRMIKALDSAMDDINEKYYKYRRWGMLGKPEVLILQSGAYANYNKMLQEKGVVLNQIKPVTVINNKEREEFFFSQVIK